MEKEKKEEEVLKGEIVEGVTKIQETPTGEGTPNPKIEEKPKMREILILTDGNSIQIEKAEVSGRIELIAIFQNLIGFLNSQQKEK